MPPSFHIAKTPQAPLTAHDFALQRSVSRFLPFGGGSSSGSGAPMASARRKARAMGDKVEDKERVAPQWRAPVIKAPSRYADSPRYKEAQTEAEAAEPVRMSAVEAIREEGATPSLERMHGDHQRLSPSLSVGPGGDAFTELRIPAALVNGMNPNLHAYVPGGLHSKTITSHRRRVTDRLDNFRKNINAVSPGGGFM